MSTQGMQAPRSWTVGPRRVAMAATLVVAGLAIGAVVGRATAPIAEVRELLRPATTLTSLGSRSIGDATRVRYLRAMNAVPVLATTGGSSPGDAARAEMFEAMSGLRGTFPPGGSVRALEGGQS